MDADVVIATYKRPKHLDTCLRHLAGQSTQPTTVVVVDASPGYESLKVTEEHGAVYLRNEHGIGATATSRAIGVANTHSEVVAFVDDDAYAEPSWLEELLSRYTDSSVGAVGGRARNGQPGEESQGADMIGRLLPNGRLAGNFAADPGRDIEVDHLLGANMSVRRSAIEAVGGIRDYYPGTCLCEETDITLRLRNAGYRIIFTPAAVVDHAAGPYARGARFDARYKFYAARNHVVLLVATLGWRSPEFRRYLGSALAESGLDLMGALRAPLDPQRPSARTKLSGVIGGPWRAALRTSGTAAGLIAACRT